MPAECQCGAGVGLIWAPAASAVDPPWGLRDAPGWEVAVEGLVVGGEIRGKGTANILMASGLLIVFFIANLYFLSERYTEIGTHLFHIQYSQVVLK